MKVLIVDDDRLCGTLAEAMAREVGVTVCGVARDAGTALAMARADPPDLVLMDMNLGRGRDDGVEAASAIYANRPCRVVFLTGYRADALMLAMIRSAVPGATVLEKPIGLQALRTVLLAAA